MNLACVCRRLWRRLTAPQQGCASFYATALSQVNSLPRKGSRLLMHLTHGTNDIWTTSSAVSRVQPNWSWTKFRRAVECSVQNASYARSSILASRRTKTRSSAWSVDTRAQQRRFFSLSIHRMRQKPFGFACANVRLAASERV